MKKIIYKNVKMVIGEKTKTNSTGDTTYEDQTMDFCYRKQLLSVLRAPKDPAKGTTIEEVRLSSKIINRIVDGPLEGPIMLEDAEHSHLWEKIEAAPMGLITPEIAQFYDDIENAETVEVPQK